ncbi:MAG TPA: SagB/ThcOx family dehydrogenase [Thermoanaerobaculales bacterium]|nr:SagB/ThcOx family dehydrogenase [Thermoanaerobaculales bacterium]
MRTRSQRGMLVASLLLVGAVAETATQETTTLALDPPDLKRGVAVMEALSRRASATEWSDQELRRQDLSDLLWAANGINRPDIGKRTAPSAMNAQDVDVYVFNDDGAYLYDARQHALRLVFAGDVRAEVTRRPEAAPPSPPPPPAAPPGEAKSGPPATPTAGYPGGAPQAAPVLLVLVSDISRFTRGTQEMKLELAAIDTGIVSQNISLFCAGTGLATRPRASMNRELIRSLLKLTDSQYPLLNHPVGYPRPAQ